MEIEKKLEKLKITLPEQGAPAAMFVAVKQTGNILFTSGQLPFSDGKLLYSGKVGDTVTKEQAEECAYHCIINMLSALKGYLGDLDKIRSVIKVQAFVNSAVGFQEQHIVVNAASDLLFKVFGEEGRHARTAVGTNQLPMDAPVEIEAILEVE